MSTLRPTKLRLARSFADLSHGGDAFAFLAVLVPSALVVGAIVGAVLGHPGYGVAVGILVGTTGWMAGVAWGHSHLIRQSPLRHRRFD
jgi:threonine/homoserine/homoserine lactone efflux protein